MLLKSAADAGMVLLSDRRVKALLEEGRKVTGVTVDHLGSAETYKANLGVVLATGGFGANREMRRKYLPRADEGSSLQPEGSQDDGVNMGLAAGARLKEGNAENAIWTPASVLRCKDGALAKFPSLFLIGPAQAPS
jgi:flavin-dependent dehydrogenase